MVILGPVKRTVAFLDVLGFRSLVAQIPASELGPRFAKIIDGVLNGLTRPLLADQNLPRLLNSPGPNERFCLVYSFSDSILLISHDSSLSSCLAVNVIALRIMQGMMAAGFPTRVGVTFGDMFVDVERAVFLGPALTAAYELEQSQDWIGGVIDESVAEPLPALMDRSQPHALQNVIFPMYRVPMKNGDDGERRTLNWRWNLVVQKGTRSLFRPTADESGTRKIARALEYAKWIRAAGLACAADQETVPVEIRLFYVGDVSSPPLFAHGDDL
ncbi:MAG: hypothetical protein ABSB35_31940 [Bryobacteraceae bacterium]|jgi:hypothetical protein